MNLPRTAVALYVALALHAVLALVLALRPAPQLPEGHAVGLVVGPVALSETELALLSVTAPPAPPALTDAANPTRGDTGRAHSSPPSHLTAGVQTDPQPKPQAEPEASSPLPSAPTETATSTESVADAEAETKPAAVELGPQSEPRVVPSVTPPAPVPDPWLEAPRSRQALPHAVTGDAVPSSPSSASASDGGGGMDTYLVRLRRHLAAHRQPLAWAGPPAVASVEVLIAADGAPLEVRLATSSGAGELDVEALALPARAAPLPRPPQGKPIRIRIPVRVSMDSIPGSP